MRATINGIKKTQDAHHLIPVQLLKESDFVKKAVEEGFNFNSKLDNGEAIEKFVKVTGLGRYGPHPKYTMAINSVFMRLGDLGINPTQLQPGQSKKLLKNLVEGNSVYDGLRKIVKDSSDKINDLDLMLNSIDVVKLLGD